MDRWRRLPETVRDAVGAVPLLLVYLLVEFIYGDGESLLTAGAVVLIMGVALTLRRRFPTATYVAAVLTVIFFMTGLMFLAVAAYTLVTSRPRTRPVVVAVASAAATLVGFLRWWPAFIIGDVIGDLVLVAAVGVLPVALGCAVRETQKRTADLEERNAELVALRGEAAHHAVQVERLRIARELHDVVAHHVSAMTVRARAGHHVADRDPLAAADALAYVADAGTQTLTAMGAFVGTLRGRRRTAPQMRLTPQPGIADLPALLESFRATGLVAHAEIADLPSHISPAVGLHTYRIVQEGLTNVIRHGAADRAWVRVWYTPGELHTQVDDDGRGCSGELPPGHGLIGVAERVALHQGRSAFGASPRGGCRLEATLAVGHPGRPTSTRADTGAVIR